MNIITKFIFPKNNWQRVPRNFSFLNIQRISKKLCFFDYYPVKILHCWEHKRLEFLPYPHYQFDLYLWYDKGLHPRFSIAEIIVKLTDKPTEAKKLFDIAKKYLSRTITKRELKKILSNYLKMKRNAENKRIKKLLSHKGNSFDFQIILKDSVRKANYIWRRLTPEEKEKIASSFQIVAEDEEVKVAIWKTHNEDRVAISKGLIITKDRIIVVDEYFLKLVEHGATAKEVLEAYKLKIDRSWDESLAIAFLRNEITADDFFRERNQTIRRRLLEKINIDEILVRLEKISSNEVGSIFRDIAENTHYLLVKDASTNQPHLLRIPNNINDPTEAKNWTFGLNGKKVKWVKET
ncbi:MAG: hypothetical protein QXI58_00910 [Candidatus Micrarchaeia archaeon]